MALRRNVLQEEDILCELYADRSSDVSGYSDSAIPTSSRKQSRSSVIVAASDSETSAIEDESCEPANSDDKTRDVWWKMDKKTKQ
jgi:hypothetical protein